MIKEEELIPIGKFQKTHALKGELNMVADIDAEYFLEGNPLILNYDGIFVPYYVESIRPKGSTSYLVKISGINTEEDASQFVNKEVFMLKKDSEEWLPDDFQDLEALIGYKIIDAKTGKNYGAITSIDYNTANILFIISRIEEGELIIPANENLIEEIDDEKKIIKMNLPDGLLEIN